MTKIRTSKKNAAIGRWIRIAALSGALVAYSASAFAVMQNNALPQGGNFVFGGKNSGITQSGNNMSITQTGQNALINWGSFNIGSIASVDFKGFDENKSAFNVINYVNAGGGMSQIHGAMNAVNGNVYLINPAGVFIGKSASINVGSLHVSNRKITDFSGFDNNTNVNDWVNKHGAMTNAELMNLGHINANHVTFDGDRIVMDMDRIAKADGSGTYKDVNITVKTTNADNVVLGYDGYNEDTKHFNGAAGEEAVKEFGNTDNFTFDGVGKDAQGNDVQVNSIKGYMWIENLEQLQAMESNKSGNYALHNGIDATETKRPKEGQSAGSTDTSFKFEAIGDEANPFTGKFDGLANNVEGVDFSIFDLNIYGRDNADGSGNRENLGLFGVTTKATIRNLTFVNGGVSSSQKVTNMGMVAGSAINSTISNIKTSADVTGTNNSTSIGGIVGSANGTTLDKLHNTGHVQGHENVGGIVGEMTGGILTENTNIGQVEGLDNSVDIKQINRNWLKLNNGQISDELKQYLENYSHNIGGLVGSANDATLGDTTGKTTIGNYLTVKGGYNVGGIVGDANNTIINHALNTGNITATGYTADVYTYWSNNDQVNDGNQIGNKHEVSIIVNTSNTGGIAGNVSGGSLENVTNDGGDVSTVIQNDIINDVVSKTNNTTDRDQNGLAIYLHEKDKGFIGGNIGGIAGKVESANITNAINKENEIRGAHNVGGIAGYLANGTVDKGVNNGGDILGTGAVQIAYDTHDNTNRIVYRFAAENVRGDVDRELVNIGNIGGIVGFMDGDESYVKDSGNRGTVHSQNIDFENVTASSKAANVGGVVGKIDRTATKSIGEIKADTSKAAVSGSYNTGDVRGYTGVGGVIGMMYNGEVTDSYNQGNIQTTRQVGKNDNPQLAVNMGGVVGDTTENTGAKALIYDVYNSGVVGDKEFKFYGRHVGGVVGRLSGDVEKSYNTGAIYNGYSVVGGITGYWTDGTIKNSFNTGNITVVNYDSVDLSSVGGIVGAADNTGAIDNSALDITNVYNLGTIRSFAETNGNSIAGIIGRLVYFDGGKAKDINVNNVYTTGNLYAGVKNNNGEYVSSTLNLGSIHGNDKQGSIVANNLNVNNAYYITPESDLFENLLNNESMPNKQATGYIDYNDRYNKNQYSGFGFSTDNGSTSGDVTGGDWRIYEGSSTPILNAFLPNAEEFFGQTGNMEGIDNIQYGTAYNPLLTIINANKDLQYSWKDLGAGKNDSFAVYNHGLILNDFVIDNGYYGGTLYSDGALKINSNGSDIKMSSASKVYGGSVNINAGSGSVDIYGHIQATGNASNTDDKDAEGNSNNGNVNITGGDIESIGTVTAADGTKGAVPIPGVGNEANHNDPNAFSEVNNPDKDMTDVDDMFGRDIAVGNGVKGNINVTATTGDADLLFGVNESGKLTAGGDLNVKAENGNIYVDADMEITGNIDLAAKGEIVLDISNVGKTESSDNKQAMHDFLNSFAKNDTEHNPSDSSISFTGLTKDKDGNVVEGENKNAMITVDMWDENAKLTDGEGNIITGAFDLGKYDITNSDGTTTKFTDALKNANIQNGGENIGNENKDIVHILVSDADQLKGVQQYADVYKDSGMLDYNFALKNNIDANGLEDYKAIGSVDKNGEGDAFSGKFNGRGNYIIGLNVNTEATTADNPNDYVGIFGHLTGEVKNVSVISSNFKGSSVGAIAGWNEGTISNVGTFGNRVESVDKVVSDKVGGQLGSAGGIAGINSGTIENVNTQDAIVAGVAGGKGGTGNDSTAGGVAGYNSGTINDSTANSAVTSSSGDANALGGVVGINNKVGDSTASLDKVESLGIINGTYNVYNENNVVVGLPKQTQNVGGIAGVNYNGASINNAYNEAYVFGMNAVGGIVGHNGEKATINNAVNSGPITGTGENAGGLVGNMADGTLSNAINTGTIDGKENVGGMVGNNGKDAKLSNLKNDGAAQIKGDKNIGGIAGTNEGTINADKEHQNLVNNGEIWGRENVGGIAGSNSGTIANTISNINLHVNGDVTTEQAQYFGGVAGNNTGTITNSSNAGDIIANGANYVGGIVGFNQGKLEGDGIEKNKYQNTGSVTGNSYVGGLIGKNESELKDSTFINSGEVIAQNGGAGGIIGDNSGDIIGSVMENNNKVTGTSGATGGIANTNSGKVENSTLTNNGVVSNKEGINVGGIFGIKTGGDITGSKLTNNGIVEGKENVGGVIGNNQVDISKSDVINTVNGYVAGTTNVGGLIGANTGRVEGGRDSEANGGNYYAHQVYNNGTVIGGTINEGYIINAEKDENGKDIIVGFENVEYTKNDQSNNIGGLIGNNDANSHLEAGYNTGSVEGGSNVGAIVGSNGGTIDQVFSTLANGNSISGKEDKTNENYLIGSGDNSKLSNAYYTDADGKQVVVDVSGKNNEWKQYNKYDKDGTVIKNLSENLLTVFLTKANIEWTKDFTYDANIHDFTIGEYVENVSDVPYLQIKYGNEVVGKITVTNPDAVHSLKDYLNTAGNDGTTLDNLIQGITGVKNAGDYKDVLYSHQINTGSGDGSPNNLGFNFVSNNNITVDKATIDTSLDIVLKDIYREYGYEQMYSDQALKQAINGYLYEITGDSGKLNEDMLNELKEKLSITYDDKAVENNLADGKKVTNNVGAYDIIANITLNGDLSDNYKLSSTQVTGTGKSHVEQTTVVVDLNDISRVYGDITTKQDYNGQIIFDKNNHGVAGFVNGDEKVYNDTDDLKNYFEANGITDGALIGGIDNPTKTEDVGDYNWSATVTAKNDDIAKNYKITYVGGADKATAVSKVTPAKLVIDLNEISRVYGNLDHNNYTINIVKDQNNKGFVNGDEKLYTEEDLGNYFDVNVTDDAAIIGGSIQNPAKTNDVGNYQWTGTVKAKDNYADNIGKNYEITYVGGNEYGTGVSKVTQATLKVDIGDIERVYGNLDPKNYNDALIIGNNNQNGFVNGDTYNKQDLIVNVTHDGAIVEGTVQNPEKTNNVGSYEWNATITTNNTKINQNYKIEYVDGMQATNVTGVSKVTPADLTITVKPQEIHKGERPAFDINSGTVDKIVNGDSLPDDFGFGINPDKTYDYNTENTYNDVLGVVINGEYYELGENIPKDGFWNNYDVTINLGDLTIKGESIPEIDYGKEIGRWHYLFDDNPFDQYCERKAEINFVDGGMEI